MFTVTCIFLEVYLYAKQCNGVCEGPNSLYNRVRTIAQALSLCEDDVIMMIIQVVKRLLNFLILMNNLYKQQYNKICFSSKLPRKVTI